MTQNSWKIWHKTGKIFVLGKPTHMGVYVLGRYVPEHVFGNLPEYVQDDVPEYMSLSMCLKMCLSMCRLLLFWNQPLSVQWVSLSVSVSVTVWLRRLYPIICSHILHSFTRGLCAILCECVCVGLRRLYPIICSHILHSFTRGLCAILCECVCRTKETLPYNL